MAEKMEKSQQKGKVVLSVYRFQIEVFVVVLLLFEGVTSYFSLFAFHLETRTLYYCLD